MKYLVIVLLAWNVITFFMMGVDKFLARKDKRRISEATLLGCAFFLGGIGVCAGMYVWHHRTRKKKFIILVPLSIIINIVAYVGLHTIFIAG